MSTPAGPTRTVLVVAPFFAPSGKVGAKRPTFLSRRWQDAGLQVHVLTLRDRYYASTDPSLEGGGQVFRTGMFFPVLNQRRYVWEKIYHRLMMNHLSLIDEYAGWIGPAVVEGLRILRTQRVDLILATGPPFSAMVAAALLSQWTSTKLVLDYRDPWTGHPWDPSEQRPGRVAIQNATPLKRRVNSAAEHFVVRRAKAVVCCTDMMARNFTEQLGAYTNATCHVVTSGYDPRPGLEPLRLDDRRKVILYAGEFYGERRLGLIVEPLLEIIAAGEVGKDEVVLHVFGQVPREDQEMIVRRDLQSMIQVHSPVDHQTILRTMAGADVLYLPSGSDVDYALPFKIFDYLSVQRPILAVAPERSAVARLMTEVDCGELAVIHDAASVRRALRTVLGRQTPYSFAGSERYHWDHLARRYAEILEGVASEP